MTGDQLPLLSHGLSPLQLGSRVRVWRPELLEAINVDA